jgi:hypothetical protein
MANFMNGLTTRLTSLENSFNRINKTVANNKSYNLKLKEVSIDLKSSNESPQATLQLISKPAGYFNKMNISFSYRAIVTYKIDPIKFGPINIETDEDGKFTFTIPQYTDELEITCHLYTKLIGYFPNNSENDFTADLLTTRLMIKTLNKIAIDTSGIDHQPSGGGNQKGPHRSSRAIGIIHIAMFEAYLAIKGGFKSLLNNPIQSDPLASVDAAICKAAFNTLLALFPASNHQTLLNNQYTNLMEQIPNNNAKTRGITVGTNAANAILLQRSTDNTPIGEQVIGIDYHYLNDKVEEWKKDPISQVPVALGSLWGNVEPFVLSSSNQFRCPNYPPITGSIYTCAYDEVKAMGGIGMSQESLEQPNSYPTETVRSDEMTEVGIYWAYDGTPSLCAPPRLYNQVALTVMDDQGIDTIDLFHLLVLLNVGMADTAIACWESKYYYRLWRPITGIRVDDGNSNTIKDEFWTPLGAPASNNAGLNFTPPFPAYPSGHATFGGLLFELLRQKFGDVPFSFISDEYNGITQDNEGNIRPLVQRHFKSLTQADEENGQSRMYLGIHWNFDKTEGIKMGHHIANWILQNAYVPQV